MQILLEVVVFEPSFLLEVLDCDADGLSLHVRHDVGRSQVAQCECGTFLFRRTQLVVKTTLRRVWRRQTVIGTPVHLLPRVQFLKQSTHYMLAKFNHA